MIVVYPIGLKTMVFQERYEDFHLEIWTKGMSLFIYYLNLVIDQGVVGGIELVRRTDGVAIVVHHYL